jgi:hypothetical protein
MISGVRLQLPSLPLKRFLDAPALLSGKTTSLNGRNRVCVKDAAGARYIRDAAGTAPSP